MVGVHVGEQHRVDVGGRDAERRQRRRQPPVRRPEDAGGAGVDEERAIAVAQEVRGDADARPGRERRLQRRRDLLGRDVDEERPGNSKYPSLIAVSSRSPTLRV